MTFRGLPSKLSADREVQSHGHEEGENGGVALRGTDEGQPDSIGPQLGLGLPPHTALCLSSEGECCPPLACLWDRACPR